MRWRVAFEVTGRQTDSRWHNPRLYHVFTCVCVGICVCAIWWLFWWLSRWYPLRCYCECSASPHATLQATHSQRAASQVTSSTYPLPTPPLSHSLSLSIHPFQRVVRQKLRRHFVDCNGNHKFCYPCSPAQEATRVLLVSSSGLIPGSSCHSKSSWQKAKSTCRVECGKSSQFTNSMKIVYRLVKM